MKKYIAGAVIVVVIIAGFIAYKVSHKPKPQQSQETKASVMATTLQKTLLLKSSGQTEEKEIETKQEAFEGDSLRTLKAGRALLENTNGTNTVLDYDTSVTIAKQDSAGTHTSNFLNVGTLWAEVKKVFGQGEYYEIETQNAVAVVRGTEFQISYLPPYTTLIVTEGKVLLIPVDPTTRVRDTDKAMLIEAGMKGTIGSDGVIVVSKTTAKDTQTDFFKMNDKNEVNNNPKTPAATTPAKPAPTPVTVPVKPQTTTTVVSGEGSVSKGPGLAIYSVTPSRAKRGEVVTVKGAGFSKEIVVLLNGDIFPAKDVRKIDDATFTMVLETSNTGTFDVGVVDGINPTVTLKGALTVY